MNKKALITGASRGIGYDMSLQFARRGYDIIATCHKNENSMLELKKNVLALGVNFDYFLCDHSDFNTAEKIIQELNQRNDTIDVLINNAGISVVGLIQDITKETWEALWNTNVTSVISLCKEVVPLMLKNNGGKIINISSVWGNIGASCECAYSATKGAINSFTKALAKELAPSNIQVNAISCGIIDTDMNAHLSEEDLENIRSEIPAGRIGLPSDIARTALALCESSSYLTGQIITVDGGWT